jgi:hypothetical protein
MFVVLLLDVSSMSRGRYVKGDTTITRDMLRRTLEEQEFGMEIFRATHDADVKVC